VYMLYSSGSHGLIFLIKHGFKYSELSINSFVFKNFKLSVRNVCE
jgi:hypothetical protein